MDKTKFFSTFVKHLRLAVADKLCTSEDDWNTAIHNKVEETEDADKANLITSRYKGEGIETHALLLDLDVEHIYVPSSTEGHGHLIVDAKLSRNEWEKVMRVLTDAGIIGPGYESASRLRGFASLRLPWVKK
jgi:hypothetical protein